MAAEFRVAASDSQHDHPLMIVDQRILQKCPLPSAAPAVPRQRIIHRMNYRDFLALFPSYVRDGLLRRAQYKDYEAEQPVFLHGDTDPFMGAVISGRLRMGMGMDHHGKGIVLGLVKKGEVFGEMSLLDNLPRTIDAITEVPSTLIIFRRDDILPMLSAYPQAMFGMIRMLCHRLRLYTDTIDIISSQNLPMRLAHFLLRIAGEFGEEVDGHIVIRAHLNQSWLGAQMAASRECINKNLKLLTMRGLIAVNGDEITILNPAGLRALAG